MLLVRQQTLLVVIHQAVPYKICPPLFLPSPSTLTQFILIFKMVNFLPIVALLSVSSVLALPGTFFAVPFSLASDLTLLSAPQTDSAPAAVLVQEAAAAAAADSKVASGTAPYTPVAKRQVPAEPPTAAAVNKSDAQALAAAAVLTAQANQVAAASSE